MFISLIITMSCMSIIYIHGLNAFVALFWFKIIILGFIFYFINSYKQKELYYYKNLGVSKLFLWISTMAIDIILFILLIIITLKIK